MEKLLKRINELANKSKTTGLTDLEKEEQNNLRQEYLKIFRTNMKSVLLNTKIIDSEGNDVTPQKIKDERKKL